MLSWIALAVIGLLAYGFLKQFYKGYKGAQAEADAEEFYDAPVRRKIEKSALIKYRDVNGTATQRQVDISSYTPDGQTGLFIGHCHLRDERRTFRFDRVKSAVDAETGEVIPDLQSYLNQAWDAAPERVMERINDEHYDEISALLYVAKADGTARAAEFEVIADACRQMTGDDRITGAITKTALLAMMVPSVVDFERCYKRLRREKPEAADLVADTCRRIIGTQKSIHPNEQAALEIISNIDQRASKARPELRSSAAERSPAGDIG